MPQLALDGRLIHYREAGSGPAVVLIHCSSSHGGQWKPLMETAGDRYRFLAPDLHGYGKSDPLPEGGAPFFRHDAEIVRALTEIAGEPVHLVGHSLGGTVAARAACDAPERVKSLTMIEPVLFNLLEEARDPRRLESYEMGYSVMTLTAFGHDEEAARNFFEFWSAPGAFDRLDDATRAYIVGTIRRVAGECQALSAVLPDQVGMERLKRLALPTALIAGAETRAAARGVIEHVRRALPNAAYREVAGAGHMSPVTHPDAVNPLILSFIDAEEERATREERRSA